MYFSIVINYIVDSIGGHRGYRRSPHTHSIIGSAIISILVSLPIIIAVRSLSLSIPKEIQLSLLALAILVGLSHVLLDMFTADGVYPLWPFKKTKVSLLQTRYDNLILNILMIIVSLLIIIEALYNEIKPHIEKLLP